MEAHQYPKGTKTVSQSRTEVTRTVFYQDINGFNRLFGGRLMEWIDVVAGVVTERACWPLGPPRPAKSGRGTPS